MKPPPLGEDNKTRERFEVSTDGLRELQAGRTPWSILKELVQNAWDETPGVTVCQVETKGVTILFPAMEEGYTLVDPRQTSATEQEKLRNKGGLKTAEAMFGHKPLAGPGITPDHEQTKFSQWVQDLASYIGLEATVRFVESPEGKAMAECTANSRCPQVTFNVSLLPKG